MKFELKIRLFSHDLSLFYVTKLMQIHFYAQVEFLCMHQSKHNAPWLLHGALLRTAASYSLTGEVQRHFLCFQQSNTHALCFLYPLRFVKLCQKQFLKICSCFSSSLNVGQYKKARRHKCKEFTTTAFKSYFIRHLCKS